EPRPEAGGRLRPAEEAGFLDDVDDLLVAGFGCGRARFKNSGHQRSVSRKAMSLPISSSVRFRLGMPRPLFGFMGFSAGGSRSQRRRFCELRSNIEPANVVRLN